MTNKQKTSKKHNPNQITTFSKPGEDDAEAFARTVLQPTVQAAVTLREYDRFYGELDQYLWLR
jgi:hypothetical protein